MAKKFIIKGDVDIDDSNDPTYGNGNLSVAQNLSVGNVFTSSVSNILGDTTITGDIIFEDNIILKQPTSYDVDSAIFTKLYQTENDTGLGEIINLTPAKFTDALQSSVGLSVNQIKLSSSSSVTVDYYVDYFIKMTSGLHINQVRKITAYNGGLAKIATINSAWSSVASTGTSNIANGSPLVTGSGTSYNTQFLAGDYISINSTTYTILTVDTPLQITLTTNATSTFSGVANRIHPKMGDTYILNNEGYSGIIYDKLSSTWKLGYIEGNPNTSNLETSRLATLQVAALESTTINGSSVSSFLDYTETIALVDNSSTGVTISSTTTRGSFYILVKSAVDEGACAIFTVTKSSSTSSPNIVANTAPSATNEDLYITYASGEKIKLYHSTLKTGGSGASLSYNVKVILIP